MWRLLLGFVILAVVLPHAAAATDLTLSFDAFADYDSNVFRRKSDVEDDVLFRLRPGIKFHEDRGQDFNYSLRYRLPLEFAVDNGDRLNDIDHLADGTVSYHPTSRVELFASDDFRYLRSVLNQDTGFDSTGVPIISSNRDRVTLNDAAIGGRYQFTPRLVGELNASHQLFETTRRDRQDNWLLSGVGDLNYALSRRHRVGLGLQYIHQDFEESTQIPASKSDSINGFARWEWEIDDVTGLSVSAGPAWIRVDQESAPSRVLDAVIVTSTSGGPVAPFFDTCLTTSLGDPYFDGQSCNGIVISEAYATTLASLPPVTISTTLGDSVSTETSLDVFARAQLLRRWSEELRTGLLYSRTQGGGSGLGGTVIRDAVTASLDWDFAERWALLLRGDWTQRKSVTEVTRFFFLVERQSGAPGDPDVAKFTGTQFVTSDSQNGIDTVRWGALGRVTHRLFRNTRVFGEATYNKQNSDGGTRGGPSDFDGWIATLGIRHEFEPIKLW